MLLGVFISPRAGVVSVAAYHLQPLIIVAGSSFRPADLWQVFLFRIPLELWQWFLTFRSKWNLSLEDPVEAPRPLYDALLRMEPRIFSTAAEMIAQYADGTICR